MDTVAPPPIFCRCYDLARAHGAHVGLTIGGQVTSTKRGDQWDLRELGELRIEAGDEVVACAPAHDLERASLELIEQMGWA